MGWAIALHGGAGDIPLSLPPERREPREAALRHCLDIGVAALKDKKTALDVVELVVCELENDPHFNAGKGSVLTSDGTVEMEACVMDGRTKKCGAVSGLTTVVNAISLARLVMEKTPHIYLAFNGAEAFAREQVDSFGSDPSSLNEDCVVTEGPATGADSNQSREIVRPVSDDIFGVDDLIIKSGADKAALSKDDPSIVILEHTKAVKNRVSQNPAKKDSKGKQSLSYGGSIKAGFFKKSLSLSSKSAKSDKKSEKVKQCLVPEYKFPSMAEEIDGTRDMSKALGLSLDGVTDEQIRDRIIQEKSWG